MISFYNNDYADFNLTLVGGVLIVVLCYISDCLRGYNFLMTNECVRNEISVYHCFGLRIQNHFSFYLFVGYLTTLLQ